MSSVVKIALLFCLSFLLKLLDSFSSLVLCFFSILVPSYCDSPNWVTDYKETRPAETETYWIESFKIWGRYTKLKYLN